MDKNEKEFVRYQELLEKKKTTKLDDKEFKEFKSLAKKFRTPKGDNGFKPGNDFSWWNKYPELLKDAVNLKCNWIAGESLIDHGTSGLYIPGCMRVLMANVYGSETSLTDAINVGARDIYLKLFQKYRGITSYEAADLGICFIATMEVFQLISKLERIYGVVNHYDVYNSNVPTTLVEALGLTQAQADYIRGHLSDYRYDLNNIIMRAQRIVLPKDFSVFADRLSLYGYVYKDHDSKRAQQIVFDYERYGLYQETAFESGGSIAFVTPSDVTLSLIDTTGTSDNMFPFLQHLVTTLLASESIIKMYGDLLAYFGPEQMLHLLPMPSEYVIEAVYSESILHKLHNAETIAPSPNTGFYLCTIEMDTLSTADKTTLEGYARPVIYQTNGVIITKTSLASAGSGSWVSIGDGKARAYPGTAGNCDMVHVLDTYRADFVDETVTEGVLWKANVILGHASTGSTDPYNAYIVSSCAYEIPIRYSIYTNNHGNVTHTNIISFNSGFGSESVRNGIFDLDVFDWQPLIYGVTLNGTQSQITRIIGDVDNVRALSPNDLTRIHRAVTLSGFKSSIQVVGTTPNK